MSNFYSGNPLQPIAYDPSYNAGNTSDPNTLQPIEKSVIYGQSVPSGNRQINSIIVPKLVGDSLTVHGPGASYIYGPVDNQVSLPQGALFGDGTPGKPTIAFASDPDTGLYHPSNGTTGFTSNGVPVIGVGSTLDVAVPITTPAGQNLIINPSGPSVDFQGHTLINVGGISSNPNYYPVVGPAVTTINTTPLIGATVPTDPDTAYSLDATITLANVTDGVSSGSIFMQTKGKNIANVLSVVSPYVNYTSNLDATVSNASASFGISGSNFTVVVTGVATTSVKWRVAINIAKQAF
jgi:hypothetical protein